MRKLVMLLVLAMAVNAMATIQITEWMYKSTANDGNAEFVELTNVGSTAVNLAGWSFDDSSATPGLFSLTGFGTVQPGESVIITEWTADYFRAEWNLASTVKVLGENGQNLGNGDAINIYNSSDALVDSLTFGKTPKTEKKSCTVPSAGLALTEAPSNWTLASVGDVYGSWKSTGNDMANPGTYYAVPEPMTIAVLALGGLVLRSFRRKF